MRHLNSILRPICCGISAYWGMHASQVLLDFTNNLYSCKIFLNLHLLTKTCDSKYEFCCPFLYYNLLTSCLNTNPNNTVGMESQCC